MGYLLDRVGAVGRVLWQNWIMPGRDGGGFFMTVLLGIIGAMVGGYVGTLLGLGSVTGFNLSSIAIATMGALIVLFVFNKIRS